MSLWRLHRTCRAEMGAPGRVGVKQEGAAEPLALGLWERGQAMRGQQTGLCGRGCAQAVCHRGTSLTCPSSAGALAGLANL